MALLVLLVLEPLSKRPVLRGPQELAHPHCYTQMRTTPQPLMRLHTIF
jgi:hypothetical protein